METSYPFATAPVYQTQWSTMIKALTGDGVVLTSDLLVIGDSSGMQVKLAAGSAFVQGFFYNNSVQKVLAIAPNASGNPRIDNIVLNCDEVGGSITAIVVAGTSASSPVPPALVQNVGGTWQVKLAQVAVANGAATITAANVTDKRMHTAPVNVTPGLALSAVVDQIVLRTGGTPTAYLWSSGQVTALSKQVTDSLGNTLTSRYVTILFTGAVAAGVWTITGINGGSTFPIAASFYTGMIQTSGTIRSVLARLDSTFTGTGAIMVSNAAGVYVPMDTATFPIANNDFLYLSLVL